MKTREGTPIRTCCGCGRRDAQATLVRVALVEGHLLPDVARTCGGRGAYLHRRAECWEGFVRAKAYVRSLRRRVTAEERRQLRARLRAGILEVPAVCQAG